MQFTTTVTIKGQATIPASIRKKLGIKPNSKVVFELKEEGAYLKPSTDFFTFKGSIKSQKAFNIKAMDKSVEKARLVEYAQKST